jgi:hypothetical protein
MYTVQTFRNGYWIFDTSCATLDIAKDFMFRAANLRGHARVIDGVGNALHSAVRPPPKPKPQKFQRQ